MNSQVPQVKAVHSAQAEGSSCAWERGPLSRAPLFLTGMGNRLRRRRDAYKYDLDERGAEGRRRRRQATATDSHLVTPVVVHVRKPYPDVTDHSRCEACGVEVRVPEWARRERRESLFKFCLELARRRYHKRNGGTCVKKVEKQAVKLAKGYDRIAAVVAKTYAVQGDAALSGGLSDDEALVRIMDILNDINPTLIERNAKKKLSRSKSG